MLAHLNPRRRPPNADYLAHFKYLSLLQLSIMIVTGFLEDCQIALNWVKNRKSQSRLAWLFLWEELEGEYFADDRGDELDTRLLKLLDELNGL